MNIVVGEYIRTKQGIIDKVILEYKGKCANPNCSVKHISCKSNYYDEEDIVKHSKNIIDLIEVGDYVNGVEVIDLADGIHLEFANDVSYVDVGLATYRDGHVEGIETIVTKEQFNNMEYRL